MFRILPVLFAMVSLLYGLSDWFRALVLEALPEISDEVAFAESSFRCLDFCEIYSGKARLTGQLREVSCLQRY